MQQVHILWTDDEIDLLKPHILFPEQRDYRGMRANNGSDTVIFYRDNRVDVFFLDEHMPGVSGLEPLRQVKSKYPTLPVVIITQDKKEQVMEKTCTRYRQGFRDISLALQTNLDRVSWADIYKELIFWELGNTDNKEMGEILSMQKTETNTGFCRFIKDNCQIGLINSSVAALLLPHKIMKEKVIPCLEKPSSCFLLVIDNLRLDQWEVLFIILWSCYHMPERI